MNSRPLLQIFTYKGTFICEAVELPHRTLGGLAHPCPFCRTLTKCLVCSYYWEGEERVCTRCETTHQRDQR